MSTYDNLGAQQEPIDDREVISRDFKGDLIYNDEADNVFYKNEGDEYIRLDDIDVFAKSLDKKMKINYISDFFEIKEILEILDSDLLNDIILDSDKDDKEEILKLERSVIK